MRSDLRGAMYDACDMERNDGIFEVARTYGDSRRCLGDLRVFGRRALGHDERRDLDVRGKGSIVASRVDENGLGGEAGTKNR